MLLMQLPVRLGDGVRVRQGHVAVALGDLAVQVRDGAWYPVLEGNATVVYRTEVFELLQPHPRRPRAETAICGLELVGDSEFSRGLGHDNCSSRYRAPAPKRGRGTEAACRPAPHYSNSVWIQSIFARSSRPTSDKVRQAVFNILGDVAGPVLDLYAGTGALAFEALSRGAGPATRVAQAGASRDFGVNGVPMPLMSDWSDALLGKLGQRITYADATGRGTPLEHYLAYGVGGGRPVSELHRQMLQQLARSGRPGLTRGNWKHGSVLCFARGGHRPGEADIVAIADELASRHVEAIVIAPTRRGLAGRTPVAYTLLTMPTT